MEYESQEQEYLDPGKDDYEGLSDNTVDTVVHNPAATILLVDDDGYYGLQHTNGTVQGNLVEDDGAVLPRHQVKHHWATVKDSLDAADSYNLNFTPQNHSYKRVAPSTDAEDNDGSDTQIIQPKRRRKASRDPVTPVTKIAHEDEEDDNHEDDQQDEIDEASEQRKSSVRMPWTSAESTRLVTARDSGQSWDEVHEVSIIPCGKALLSVIGQALIHF